MMSPSRKLNMLLLFLSVSSFFTSRLPAHAATTSFPSIVHMADSYEYHDYNENPDDVVKSVTVRTVRTRQDMRPCPYDACSEDQKPCQDLGKDTGCLCPGMSGPKEPPHSARLHSLLSVSKGSRNVEVRWCAPSSVVTGYSVVVDGKDESFQFPAASRKGVVGTLESGTKVCVMAVNDAGQSVASKFSCKRYDIPDTPDNNLLAGVIGGGIALLLLLVVVSVVIWKFRMYKKAKRDSADGLGNPSYSMGENL